MTKCVFAGTFDPFTLGHKDIVMSASAIFDEVVIAIAEQTMKNNRSLEIRKKIIKLSTGIDAVGFDGLLTDFMRDNQINVLIRGVRSQSDFEYERNLAEIYRSLYPSIEVVLIPARGERLHVSSTVVRQLAKLNSSLCGYVDTKAEKYIAECYSE